MLHSEHKHAELEEILQELVTSSNKPTSRLLTEFVQRHPHFANEILSFASEWAVQESIGESEKGHEIDGKLSQTRAQSALKDALFRFDLKITAEPLREVAPV